MRKYVLGLSVFVASALLFASGDAPSEINWWSLGSEYQNRPALGWYLLTFAIFVFGLVYYLRKPLQIYLETRAKDIEKAINEAKIAKEQAKKRVAEYEKRVLELDADIERLKEDFKKQGQAEKEAFEASAQALAKQIALEAEQTMQVELQKAMMQLKRDMAHRVTLIAQEQLREGAGHEVARKLKQQFSDELRDIRN